MSAALFSFSHTDSLSSTHPPSQTILACFPALNVHSRCITGGHFQHICTQPTPRGRQRSLTYFNDSRNCCSRRYFDESGTHHFEDISFSWSLVVYGQPVSGAEHKLLQVQSQRPRVMRIQSPDTEQGWATDGRWGEGPVEGLKESSARPLNRSGSHSELHRDVSHPSLLLFLCLFCKQRQQIGLIVPLRTRIFNIVSVFFAAKFGLFIQCAIIFWQGGGDHDSVAALFIWTTTTALPQTLHLAVATPSEGQTAASEAPKGCCWAFARI